MIPVEIMKKIKRLHIKTSRLATNIFAGDYKSVFKGRGLEFFEVREYVVGDEIRQIDWNVTARTGSAHIKKFVEERELTIMFLIDISGSSGFGSVDRLKRDLEAEICAVLASSASKNNDKVGLIMFSDIIEKYIAPKKGRHHNLRLIRVVLYTTPNGKGTDIPLAFQFLNMVMKKSCVVFLISDLFAENIRKPLLISSKKHDLITIRVNDPVDHNLPDVGFVNFRDPETQKKFFINTADSDLRKNYSKSNIEHFEKTDKLLKRLSIDNINISTTGEYVNALVDFFEKRKMRRKGRG